MTPKVVRVLAIFGVLGPIFGSFPFLIPLVASSKAPLLAFFFVATFAYLIGIVPALLAGSMFFWAQMKYTKAYAQPLPKKYAILLGFGMGCLAAAIFLLFLGQNSDGMQWPSSWLIVSCSALGGLFCGLITSFSNTRKTGRDLGFDDFPAPKKNQ